MLRPHQEDRETMSANDSTDAPQPMTQLDYAERRLEERDSGTQTAASLLSALASGLGVLSIWFAPMVIGFFAIGFAILGLAISGERDRIGKIGLILAVGGWLIGSILAVILGRNPLSLGLA